jgi:hypothetical protein
VLLLQLTLLFVDPVRGTEFAQASLKNQSSLEQPADLQAAVAREAEFKKRFNNLVNAVAEFAAVYNDAHGQVWPAKKAEVLRKAMKDLEKAHPSLK